MKRYGAFEKSMQSMEMDETAVFIARLDLLMVMVKAALKGYPVGEFRKKAVLENAGTIHQQMDQIDLSFISSSTSSHMFRQRVKLLCVMATAIVSETYPLGIHRQEAVLENLDMIAEYAFSEKKVHVYHDILKVA